MQAESDSRIASMFAALSQPTRLRIISVVAAGPAEGTPAGEIARAVHCPASTLSFHLKELSQAGLLKAEPQGRFIRYSVVAASFQLLADFVGKLPGEPAPGRPAAAAAERMPRKARKKATREAPQGPKEGQLSIFDE